MGLEVCPSAQGQFPLPYRKERSLAGQRIGSLISCSGQEQWLPGAQFFPETTDWMWPCGLIGAQERKNHGSSLLTSNPLKPPIRLTNDVCGIEEPFGDSHGVYFHLSRLHKDLRKFESHTVGFRCLPPLFAAYGLWHQNRQTGWRRLIEHRWRYRNSGLTSGLPIPISFILYFR